MVKERIVFLLGITGSGKSTAANVLVDGPIITPLDPIFPVSWGAESETQKVTSCVSRVVLGTEMLPLRLRVHDTPGIHDTFGRSQAIFDAILEVIGQAGGLVLYMVKGERISEMEKRFMQALRLVFGDSFASSVVLVKSGVSERIRTEGQYMEAMGAMKLAYEAQPDLAQAGVSFVKVISVGTEYDCRPFCSRSQFIREVEELVVNSEGLVPGHVRPWVNVILGVRMGVGRDEDVRAVVREKKRVQEEVQVLQGSRMRCEDRLEGLQRENSEVEKEMESVQIETQALAKELESLKEEKSAIDTSQGSLNAALKGARDEKDRLAREEESLCEEKAKREEKLKMWEAEKNASLSRLETKERELKACQAGRAHVERERETAFNIVAPAGWFPGLTGSVWLWYLPGMLCTEGKLREAEAAVQAAKAELHPKETKVEKIRSKLQKCSSSLERVEALRVTNSGVLASVSEGQAAHGRTLLQWKGKWELCQKRSAELCAREEKVKKHKEAIQAAEREIQKEIGEIQEAEQANALAAFRSETAYASLLRELEQQALDACRLIDPAASSECMGDMPPIDLEEIA